jgi:opacity protein-like surface antigen
MRHPFMRLVLLALLLSASTARAADLTPWVLRGQALESDYEKTATDSSISGTSFLDLSSGSGFQAALEYRRNRVLGWEVSVGQLDIDATSRFSRLVPISFDPLVLVEQVTVSDLGTIALRPVTAGPLFHFPAGRLVDVYLGPFLGAAIFDVNADMPERDLELIYGAKLGAEVQLGSSNWALGIELRHLQVDHETLERDLYRDIDVQTLGVGLSYHLPN